MNSRTCMICGASNQVHENWFLIAENPYEDRLRITSWHSVLAKDAKVSSACSADHILELLTRWANTGTLCPDSKSILNFLLDQQSLAISSEAWELAGQIQPIGELAIHRGALHENPEALKSLLKAIASILRNEEIVLKKKLPSRAVPQTPQEEKQQIPA